MVVDHVRGRSPMPRLNYLPHTSDYMDLGSRHPPRARAKARQAHSRLHLRRVYQPPGTRAHRNPQRVPGGFGTGPVNAWSPYCQRFAKRVVGRGASRFRLGCAVGEGCFSRLVRMSIARAVAAVGTAGCARRDAAELRFPAR
jgi:hypothetical protein